MTVTFVYWLTSAILYCRLFSDWGSIYPSDANSINQEHFVILQVVYNVYSRNVSFKGYKLKRVTCQLTSIILYLCAGCVLQSVRAILRATLSGVRVPIPMLPRI